MRVLRPVTWLFGVAGGLGIVLLMLVTVVDVILRKAAGQGIPSAVESSEILLVACVFLGLGAAQATGAHVKTSVLTSRLPARAARLLRASAGSLAAVMLAVLLVATSDRALSSVSSGEYRFGLVAVPIWPARVTIAVGVLVLLAEFLRTLWRDWRSEEQE